MALTLGFNTDVPVTVGVGMGPWMLPGRPCGVGGVAITEDIVTVLMAVTLSPAWNTCLGWWHGWPRLVPLSPRYTLPPHSLVPSKRSILAGCLPELSVSCHMGLSIGQLTTWQYFPQSKQGRKQERTRAGEQDGNQNLFPTQSRK